MNIAQSLRETVLANSERSALVYLGSGITYDRLWDWIESFARGLSALGVNAGDRVVIYLPNSPQWVVAWAALQRLGAVAVPLTPFYGDREISYVCRDAEARVVICTDVNYGYVAAVAQELGLEKLIVTNVIDLLPGWKRVVGSLLDQVPRGAYPKKDPNTIPFRDVMRHGTELPTIPERGPRDIAEILYTGGTTGEPKGVPIAQGQFLVATEHQRRQSESLIPRGTDVVLQGAPLFHILGQTVGLGALLAGDTLVVLPRMNLDAVMDHIQRFRAVTLFGVPAFFRMILEHDRLDGYDLSSLRYCFSGGDVLPREVGERWMAEFGVRIFEGYGATETCGGISLAPIDAEPPPGSVGRLLPIHEAKLVEPGTSTEIAPGEAGELLLHSEPMVEGYFNKPDETATAFLDVDGKRWYRTGDIVRIDDDGWLFFVDRSADTIKHKGYRVAASKIEAVLEGHPAVISACAVGVPDEQVGERVKALVVVKSDATNVSVDELQRWCRERLASYERPSSLEFRDMLPTSKVGKLLRREIRDEERRRRGISEGESYLVS